MTRSEHIQCCKDRANQEIDRGNIQEAFMSMASDLDKHPETQEHIGIKMGLMQLMGGFLNTPDAMRNFINGFN